MQEVVVFFGELEIVIGGYLVLVQMCIVMDFVSVGEIVEVLVQFDVLFCNMVFDQFLWDVVVLWVVYLVVDIDGYMDVVDWIEGLMGDIGVYCGVVWEILVFSVWKQGDFVIVLKWILDLEQDFEILVEINQCVMLLLDIIWLQMGEIMIVVGDGVQ